MSRSVPLPAQWARLGEGSLGRVFSAAWCIASGILVLAGLASGARSAIVHGLEMLALALLARDAWRLRSRAPLLGSARRRLAVLGWLLVLALAASIALLV